MVQSAVGTTPTCDDLTGKTLAHYSSSNSEVGLGHDFGLEWRNRVYKTLVDDLSECTATEADRISMREAIVDHNTAFPDQQTSWITDLSNSNDVAGKFDCNVVFFWTEHVQVIDDTNEPSRMAYQGAYDPEGCLESGGDGGSDNGGSDNVGSDNGGSDNGGSD